MDALDITVNSSELDEVLTDSSSVTSGDINREKYKSLSSSEEDLSEIPVDYSQDIDSPSASSSCIDIPVITRTLRPSRKRPYLFQNSESDTSSGEDDEVKDESYKEDLESDSDNSESETQTDQESADVVEKESFESVCEGSPDSKGDSDSTVLSPPVLDDLPDTDSDQEINIKDISFEFKRKLRRFGISHRQASRMILKCSQSNLSEAFKKAKKLGTSKKLTLKGKQIYQDMQDWVMSKEKQRQTIQLNAQQKMLSKTPSVRRNSGGRKGTQFTFVQLCVLVELFKKNDRPSKQRKELISETLGLNESQVTTWFNNQRARDFIAEKQVEKMKRDGQQADIPHSWGTLLNS